MEEKPTPRNLVKLGSNSFVVTLPKKWIISNRLSKGDVVYTFLKNNVVSIKTDKKPAYEPSESTIESCSLPELKAKIITAYIDGVDVIKILKNDYDIRKIKTIVHDLVGLEIIQQTNTSIIAKELLDLEKTSIKNITRRIDYLVRGMLKELLTCKMEDDYLNIYDRDFDVNRLSYLVFRTVNKALTNTNFLETLKMSLKQLIDYRNITFNIEQIGDQAKRIAKLICMLKSNRKEIIGIVDYYEQLYRQTLDIFYKNDKKNAFKIALDNDNRISMLRKVLQKNQDYIHAQVIHLFLHISRSLRDIARIVCSSN